MFRIIRSKETSKIAMVILFEPNKWGNLNNVRHEAADISGKIERKYMEDRINELATQSKSKNITELYRGMNEFKKGYQPRTDLVKD
jgi:hypothetical protein